LFRGLDTSTA